ncbi:survival motor neuron protein isoform X2 [Oncorhynchus tshawytscha]|uniref:survival motor neuron protein isoform X2 n=1 Tax=Oncorhynchus tshawytscha TaxID=74940 RepID=UPI000D0981CE|nr:survival motor neuron protein isoform X2 [Oncorhynchus tshawytscha]XP_024276851.1 survival motor neuron protein isoform X2 [Oncorhynchus tshawytscha]XP_042177949.1 survival motor neuron protein isoform X2 [Oncorhynchus tshawytscha]
MDEYYESIVFRSERVEDNVSLAVSTDDSALVKAYEDALRTFRRAEKESGEKLADNPQTLSESYVPTKGPVDPKTNSKVWRLGYRCRAVYSEDGLVYPAVLVWLRGERCRVKFEGYGNEEELELSSLLSPVELGGHRGRVDAKVQQGAVDGFSSTSNNIADWKRMERDWRTAQQEGREELSSPQPSKFAPVSLGAVPSVSGHLEYIVDQWPCFTEGKDYGKCSYDFGKEHGDKKKPSGRREVPNNHPFSFFPPVPKESLDFLPPPPPPCVWPPRAVLADASNGLDSAVTDISSMLLSWYLCGYHTGCYMAMQQTKTSRRRADKEKQAEE